MFVFGSNNTYCNVYLEIFGATDLFGVDKAVLMGETLVAEAEKALRIFRNAQTSCNYVQRWMQLQ